MSQKLRGAAFENHQFRNGLGLVVHPLLSQTLGVDVRRSRVQSHPQLQNDFKASLGDTGNPVSEYPSF